jgi:hypothetical protein
MKKTGYLVWVNDDQFWHSTLEAARKQSKRAEIRGNDTIIVAFEIRPYLVSGKNSVRAA